MAFGLSIISEIVVEDSKGAQSTISYNHPLNVDIGALKSAIQSTCQLIDALIGGKIITASIGIEVQLPGSLSLKTTAIAGADIEEGVRFTFETSSGAETGFRIPTFAESFLSEAGILQTGVTAVDNFIARMLDGVTSGLTNVSPSDGYGDDITAFTVGQESFANSRG